MARSVDMTVRADVIDSDLKLESSKISSKKVLKIYRKGTF